MTKDTIDKLPSTLRSKCGTYAGVGLHIRNNEIVCNECVLARREYGKLWVKNNPEKSRQRDLRYAETHRDQINEYKCRYRKEHPEKYRESSSRRRARQHKSNYDYFTEKEVLATYGDCCHICLAPIDLTAPRQVGHLGWEQGLHIDHLVPLAKGGGHTLSNVRPAHGLCNLNKSTKEYTKTCNDRSTEGPTI